MNTRTMDLHKKLMMTAMAIFAAAVIIFAFPARADAAGGIYLCGTDISGYQDGRYHTPGSPGSPQINGWTGGKFMLSDDGTTLYFDGFRYSEPSVGESCTIISAERDLKIIVSGNNTFGNNDFIDLSGTGSSYCDLVLQGNGGSSITLGTPGMGSMMNVGNLTFSGCSFTAGAPVRVVGTMTFSSGSFKANGISANSLVNTGGSITSNKTSAYYAVDLGSAEIRGGSLTTDGRAVLNKGLTQTGGTVFAAGDIITAYEQPSEGGLLKCSGGTMESNGDIKAQKGMEVSGTGSVKARSVFVTGKFTGSGGTATAANLIYVSGDMEISGAAVETKSQEVLVTGSLTVTSGSLTAANTISSNDGKVISVGDHVTITGGRVTARRTGSGATARVLDWKRDKVTLGSDMWISVPSDGYLPAASDLTYLVRDANGREANEVTIQKVSSISVAARPGNIDGLYSGDSYSPDGLVLNVKFADGSTSGLTYNDGHKAMFSFGNPRPNQPLDPGSKNVSITCLTKSASMSFTVREIGKPQLTASADGYDKASLSWNAAEGAAEYDVYRQKGSAGFTKLATTAGTSLEDTGLDTGAEYTYYVTAKRGSVVSAESNRETVTPAFTGSTALTVSNNGAGYSLAWDAVSGATSYEIWRGDGENGEQSLLAEADANSYTDSSADSYSTYNYMVKPRRSVGDDSFYADSSNVAVGKANEKPQEPEKIVPPQNDDPSGTEFSLLQAKAGKATKTSVKIGWKRVPGAKEYVIYGNKCGSKNKYVKLTTTTGLAISYKNVAGQKVKKGTYYKFIVYAVDANGRIVSTSKTVHVATPGGKVGNDKKVTTKAKKGKVTLKTGKKFKLKAKAVPASKKLKVRRHRKMAYETSNAGIATVTSKGVIQGVSRGSCYVYAYTQNGVCAKVKVTVK